MAAASEQTFAAMFDKTTTKCDINSGTSMMLYQIGIFNALKASQLTSLGKYNESKKNRPKIAPHIIYQQEGTDAQYCMYVINTCVHTRNTNSL